MLWRNDDESCLIEDALRPRAPLPGGEETGLHLTVLGPLEGIEGTKDRQREHGRDHGCCR